MALPNLTDLFIANCYRGYLHTSNTPLTGEEYVRVYDGLGNPSALQVSGGGIKVNNFVFKPVGGEAKDKQIQKINKDGESVFDYLYPIGAVYLSVNSTNPSQFFGGTWVNVSKGKFLAGVGTGIDSIEGEKTILVKDNNGGKYKQTLTNQQIPPHNHFTTGARTGDYLSSDPSKSIAINSNQASGNNDYALFQGGNATAGVTSTYGQGNAFDATPPSFGVYVWERTA